MRQDRMTRINELVRRELGMLFERLVAPQTPGALVTVTRVETTPDLRHARVFVSLFGKGVDRAGVMAVIQEQRAEMQQEINRNIHIKFTPVLEFVLDDTMESAERVLSLLDSLVQDEPPGDRNPDD